MIAQEKGLLPIITFDAQTTWDDVPRVAWPHLRPTGLERLKKAVGKTTASVAVERHYIDKDYRDTFTNFHAKKFSTPDSRCIRLHFFDVAVDHATIRDVAAVEPHYTGYSVIRPTQPNCIGRTLLAPANCGVRDAHVRTCEESISIQGTELRVRGFPFISQDADVTVCAQSALWMLVRHFSNRYRIYPEVCPYGLTSLAQDYSIGRLVPSGGLYIWQMAEALRQLGFSPLIYDRDSYSGDFDHLMYTYVESGIPVLAAFDRHVVVVFGHCSDFSNIGCSTPTGGANFVFSSRFNRAFVGNDDNGWPYQLLSSTNTRDGMPYTISNVMQFVAPLPERVFLSADKFQQLVVGILAKEEVGFKALSHRLTGSQLCLRLFLTSGRSFKKRLSSRGMGSPLVLDTYRNLPLPHFIWVCEISDLELYPKQVLGEIIWDATRNEYEPNGWIALHYPEILLVDVGSALNGPAQLVKSDIGLYREYPIYENNLERL